MSTPFTSNTAPSLIDIDASYLPVSPMRQVTRVVELAGPRIVAEADLGPDHWVYPVHFPGDPIFPGALIIEAAGQVVALWAWADGQRGRPRLLRVEAEFRAPVLPDDPRLIIEATVIRRRKLNFAEIIVRTANAKVAGVKAVLTVIPAAGTPAP